MSVQSEINRISTNIENSFDEIAKYGVSVQSTDTSDQLATRIAEISDRIPQSDWNQEDTTAKDYIKNKPTLMSAEEIESMVDGFVKAEDSLIEAGDAEETLYTTALRKTEQILTNEEKEQVRLNIGAIAMSDIQGQLESTGYATETWVNNEIDQLSNSIMSKLDELNELANSIIND